MIRLGYICLYNQSTFSETILSSVQSKIIIDKIISIHYNLGVYIKQYDVSLVAVSIAGELLAKQYAGS